MSNATSREENQKTKWELVGDVSVDTGQVVIVDPFLLLIFCYCSPVVVIVDILLLLIHCCS